MFKTFLAPLAAPLLLAAPIPATAGDASILVGYADLDLASPQGIAALNGRIDAAVNQVCGRPDHRDPAMARDWQACRTQARAQTHAQIATAIEHDRADHSRLALAAKN